MVPKVVPKIIKSKTMIFELSKTVSTDIMSNFNQILRTFEISSFSIFEKSDFMTSDPKFELWVPFWVPSKFFSESIIINLFQKKNGAVNSPYSLV